MPPKPPSEKPTIAVNDFDDIVNKSAAQNNEASEVYGGGLADNMMQRAEADDSPAGLKSANPASAGGAGGNRMEDRRHTEQVESRSHQHPNNLQRQPSAGHP